MNTRAPHAIIHHAGGLVRHICKALEEVGILEKSSSVKGGRKLTGSGQRDMDLIAGVWRSWCSLAGHAVLCW